MALCRQGNGGESLRENRCGLVRSRGLSPWLRSPRRRSQLLMSVWNIYKSNLGNTLFRSAMQWSSTSTLLKEKWLSFAFFQCCMTDNLYLWDSPDVPATGGPRTPAVVSCSGADMQLKHQHFQGPGQTYYYYFFKSPRIPWGFSKNWRMASTGWLDNRAGFTTAHKCCLNLLPMFKLHNT